MPTKAKPVPFVDVPFSWTGFYVGVERRLRLGPLELERSDRRRRLRAVQHPRRAARWATRLQLAARQRRVRRRDRCRLDEFDRHRHRRRLSRRRRRRNARPSRIGSAPRAAASATLSAAGCLMSPAAPPTATSRPCSRTARTRRSISAGPPAAALNIPSTTIGAPRSSICISISAPRVSSARQTAYPPCRCRRKTICCAPASIITGDLRLSHVRPWSAGGFEHRRAPFALDRQDRRHRRDVGLRRRRRDRTRCSRSASRAA